MKIVNASSQSLLPESIHNLIESINCASRIVLRTCEGAERAVIGIDEISTLMLSQQRQRLLLELTPA